MPTHSSLTGNDLHDPKGKYPTALTLADNQAAAYEIENSGGESLLQIDTTNSSERLWVGSAGASGQRLPLGMLCHSTDTTAPTAPSQGGLIYVKYNGVSAYNVYCKGSDNTEYQLNTSGGGGAPTTSQYVTLATDATLTQERVLTGTTNQITITDNGAGSTVVLSTPQNLHTGATPTFAGGTFSGLTTFQNGIEYDSHTLNDAQEKVQLGTITYQSTTSGNFDIAVLTLEDDTAYLCWADVVARHSSGTSSPGRGAFSRRVLVYREATGVATIEGTSTTDPADVESHAGTHAAWYVTGANNVLYMRVTGLATTNIEWHIDYKIKGISTVT